MNVWMEKESMPSDFTLDLRIERCPLTFVKIKLTLENLDIGDTIIVQIGDPESIRNVPRSLEAEGCDVFNEVFLDDGVFQFHVQKTPAVSW